MQWIVTDLDGNYLGRFVQITEGTVYYVRNDNTLGEIFFEESKLFESLPVFTN